MITLAQKTDAQKRAQKAYISKFVRVEVRMEQESQANMKAHAAARGESVNAFIARAIRETMERDGARPPEA